MCRAHGVTLLADSAASIGSRIDGRAVACEAEMHAYSMSFAKVLSAGGAGGAVVLPADADVDGEHGWARSALMNELHAVVALDQLAVLDQLVARRRRAVARYIEECGLLGLEHQHEADDVTSSWVHFVLRAPDVSARDRLAAELDRFGVATKPYFTPLHEPGDPDQAQLGFTNALGRQALALPLSSELGAEAADRVAVALARAADVALGGVIDLADRLAKVARPDPAHAAAEEAVA